MISKLKQSCEKLVESFTACGLMMVQGDLSIFTLKHFLTAAEVGALTAMAYFVSLSLNFKFPYAPLFLTGVFTAIADWIIHDPMFPYESLATGVCAVVIAGVYDKLRGREWI